jgi:hypothetical protein
MNVKTLLYHRLVFQLFSLSIGVFLLFSCGKDAGVIEKKFGIVKIDRSIPTDFNITEFSVVNENLIFAIGTNGNQTKIFKTADGGITWNPVNVPAGALTSVDIQSIMFFDENLGAFAANNRAYRTYDGGQTWSNVLCPDYTGNNSINDFCFVGKSEAGEMIFAESNGSSWDHNHIVTSPPDSPTYSIVYHYAHAGIDTDYCSYSNGRLHFLARDFNNWDDEIYVYDFNTGTRETIPISGDLVLDAHYADNKTLVGTEEGKIYFKDWYSAEWNVSRYNFHSEDYHAIEYMDGYYVAVGNRTISTNFNVYWEEAINIDGTGHSEHFRQIQKIDATSAYISGDNGLFIKVNF